MGTTLVICEFTGFSSDGFPYCKCLHMSSYSRYFQAPTLSKAFLVCFPDLKGQLVYILVFKSAAAYKVDLFTVPGQEVLNDTLKHSGFTVYFVSSNQVGCACS